MGSRENEGDELGEYLNVAVDATVGLVGTQGFPFPSRSPRALSGWEWKKRSEKIPSSNLGKSARSRRSRSSART